MELQTTATCSSMNSVGEGTIEKLTKGTDTRLRLRKWAASGKPPSLRKEVSLEGLLSQSFIGLPGESNDKI